MFAPALRRAVFETTTRVPTTTTSILPPAFLLPFSHRAPITTVSHSLETGNVAEPLLHSGQHISSGLKEAIASRPTSQTASSTTPSPAFTSVPYGQQSLQVRTITPQIRQLLPLLRAQSAHYITVHIHGRPYLLTQGDTLRLPFLMKDVQPGDILRLNRATHIGSRDYTLKAPATVKGTRDSPKQVFYLDERLFVCRATVVGTELEPERVKEKTKRRQRHVRHVRSQHRYTVLKISQVEVRSLEEYDELVMKEQGRKGKARRNADASEELAEVAA
ncbi:uncharacterized protein EI97DRAFT_432317 [Westerdykella ornata]|uniref:Large ribosomal subunit protein bL21m n=1 Tax=Westerdykella ornata TaxID=318751 RepID=A0A6A6JLA3_WESOR|nr:uncharacterized protein EI97DRAFT_432317 [Westerdykella ornata]KAF2277440.1 hypothetical protein EI97DRAFT_432317 [Westerdykella ornata]